MCHYPYPVAFSVSGPNVLPGNSLSALSSGYAFLNSVTDAGKCSSSLPSRFTPGESQYPLNSRLILVRGIVVGFTAEEKVFCPMQGIRTGCSLSQPLIGGCRRFLRQKYRNCSFPCSAGVRKEYSSTRERLRFRSILIFRLFYRAEKMKVVRLKGSTHILAFISTLNSILDTYFVCFCRIQVDVLKLRHIFYMIY